MGKENIMNGGLESSVAFFGYLANLEGRVLGLHGQNLLMRLSFNSRRMLNLQHFDLEILYLRSDRRMERCANACRVCQIT